MANGSVTLAADEVLARKDIVSVPDILAISKVGATMKLRRNKL